MPFDPPTAPLGLSELAGETHWQRRMAEIAERASPRSRQGRAAQQHHALELILERLARQPRREPLGRAETIVLQLAQEALALAAQLPAAPRERLRQRLLAGLTGEATLVPLFHLLREAARQRARGFSVAFTGLTEDTPYDLLLQRDGVALELACETVSAEAGRQLNRGDWHMLVDRIDPGLQTWLAAHPGRYLLKMTLPQGIQTAAELAELQGRINDLLVQQKRQCASPAAVLKLDPLTLAGAQAGQALPQQLRQLFGPDAHLAVTGSPGCGSLFVMAARAGRENGLAAVTVQRLGEIAARRFSGTRPALAAVFLEDLERQEWRALRDTLELEGAVRRFFTRPEARPLAAVSCCSRLEIFGSAPPEAVEAGELRFANPNHPQARLPALQPAVASLG